MSTLASFTFTPIDRETNIDVRIEFGGVHVYNFAANTKDPAVAITYAIEFVASVMRELFHVSQAGGLT